MKATADICDQLGNKVRVLKSQWQNFGAIQNFFGPVATVRAPEDNSKVREALEEPGYGRILVVDGLGSRECALLGGNLANLAVVNGWAGVVINGCIRDLKEISSEKLGVRALGTCPRKSVKLGRGELDVALNFDGVIIRPGNIMFADEDGIVLVDSNQAEMIHS